MEKAPETNTPEDLQNIEEHQKNNAELKDLEKSAEKERKIEELEAERGNMLVDILTSEIVSTGLDFVPFVGGAKMLVESIAGETLSHDELTPKERIIHGAVGATVLALDFIPLIGTAAGEGLKAGVLAGRSAGMVGKIGIEVAERGLPRAGEIFAKTSEFMAEHPKLTEKAEKFAEGKIKEYIRRGREYREPEGGLENAA